jgi:hypothetical protein
MEPKFEPGDRVQLKSIEELQQLSTYIEHDLDRDCIIFANGEINSGMKELMGEVYTVDYAWSLFSGGNDTSLKLEETSYVWKVAWFKKIEEFSPQELIEQQIIKEIYGGAI